MAQHWHCFSLGCIIEDRHVMRNPWGDQVLQQHATGCGRHLRVDPKLPRGLMGCVGLAPRTKIMQYFGIRLKQGTSSTDKPMQEAWKNRVCGQTTLSLTLQHRVPARFSNRWRSVRKVLGIWNLRETEGYPRLLLVNPVAFHCHDSTSFHTFIMPPLFERLPDVLEALPWASTEPPLV